MRCGLGVILVQVVRDPLRVDAAIFNLDRNIVLIMHHHRMEDPGALVNVQLNGLFGAGLRLFKHQHFAVVLMVAGGNFIGNAADFKQRRLSFWLGDKGSDTLQTHQQPFIGQFPQRPVNGHSTKAKLRDQFSFGGNTVVRTPDAGSNFFADRLFHLLIKRCGWAGGLLR